MLEFVKDDYKKAVDIFESEANMPFAGEVESALGTIAEIIGMSGDSGHKFDDLCRARRTEMDKINLIADNLIKEGNTQNTYRMAQSLQNLACCKLGQFYSEA